uniref:Uncharacterized protein n=1 Tax=Panagrolaimus superbus TaxID=310955 RepID=A0A914YBE4_9BILA
MEAMRTYTATAQSTASSPIINSTPVTTTNAVATNPLLSHALNTAGIIKNNKNHQATTSSTSLESIINRKRSADEEIIQIDDDQPMPRRHCPNANNQCSGDFSKPLTNITSSTPTVATPSKVSTPSSLPLPLSSYSRTPSSFPLENSNTPAAVEGHRYVTLPTIPPISILVPNDIKIMDKLDEIINSAPSNFNPSTINLNGQTNSAIQEVSAGLMPSTKQISTSVPSQLLLEGLRHQKPHDSRMFKDSFCSDSVTAPSQLNNPISTNSTFNQMFPQNLNNNDNNSNIINFDNNQLLNVVPPPQWIQLIQQPQHNPPQFQKSSLLQQQIQAASSPHNFQQSFQSLQNNQPFLPTITNQPQLRFSVQPLPPTSNAGLSALLSQNNPTNYFKSINENQQNSMTPSLPINTSVGIQILNQPQQNKSESASNLSNNNLINFANFTLPTLTPPQPPFILQAQFQQPQKPQIPDVQQQQQQQLNSKQITIQQQQSTTSRNLFEQIQQQQQRLVPPKTPNSQPQLPPMSRSVQTPTSQSNSSSLNSITKMNFPIEQQPFAQYLLNLPSMSPSGSTSNTTPQLPSVQQSPSDVSTENGSTSSFTPNITEQLFTSTTMSSHFDTSNLKHSPTDQIASSFIDGDGTAENKKTMTVGSVVAPTYLDVLQSNMIILSSTGQQMVK